MKERNLYKEYDYSTIDHANCVQANNKTVKIRCRVIELKNPLMKKNLEGKFKAVSSATLSDEYGNSIGTTDFSKSRFKRLKDCQQKGIAIDVIAEIVKTEVKNDRYKNQLKLRKCRPGTRPLRQLQASADEICHAKKIVAKAIEKSKKGNNWWLLNAIEKAAVDELDIMGEKTDELLMDAMMAMICQAFSGGTVNNANGKIHTCIIGPPASGKKLLWETAKLLNVASEEAQASRTTPAGLTATMVRKNDNWCHTPGKIPLASGGVFGIQDFDKRKEKGELFSILGDVMEDGQCLISGAARATLKAKTAIHIDLNRQTDLQLAKNKLANVIEDTKMPAQIISRLDFIIEFERDLALQNEKAISMLGASSRPNKGKKYIPKYCEKHGLEVGRLLKLIVAFVTEEFAEIDRRPVLEYTKQKFSQIEQINEGILNKIEEMSLFKTRMSNSVIKFIEAITRVQLLKESNKKAVDLAFHLLSRKLDFLRNINPAYLVPGYRNTGKEAFGMWLCDHIGAERFSVKEIQRAYKKDYPCGEAADRTLRSWISAFADRKCNKQWKINSSFLKAYSGGDS